MPPASDRPCRRQSVWHSILDNFRPISIWLVELLLYYVFTNVRPAGNPSRAVASPSRNDPLGHHQPSPFLRPAGGAWRAMDRRVLPAARGPCGDALWHRCLQRWVSCTRRATEARLTTSEEETPRAISSTCRPCLCALGKPSWEVVILSTSLNPWQVRSRYRGSLDRSRYSPPPPTCRRRRFSARLSSR